MHQEEKAFLSSYHLEDYPRPSVTSDIAVFSLRNGIQSSYRHEPMKKLCILLIKRGNPPYQDCWALPGGFLQPGETMEECAGRELREETGADVHLLRHIGIFSEPERDPRGWIISNAFLSVLSEGKRQKMKIQGGDDAVSAVWFDVEFSHIGGRDILMLEHEEIILSAELEAIRNPFDMCEFRITENHGLAFDHAKMIASAVTCLRKEAERFQLIFDFLPDTFTLTELQKVQEAVTGQPTLAANFRRKAADYVAETDELTQGAGHRPARLYRRDR